MNAGKKMLNKTELIDWLNSCLKPDNLSYTKIQQLGTGVGYLCLLNYIHPGILNGVKYNKKPMNQYEYHLNLRILGHLFQRLSISKSVDMDKLCKMKMQDNLQMLQWFYVYSHSNLHRKQEKVPAKQALQNKKNLKTKPIQKINIPLQKSNMIDREENISHLEIKIINSASKRIYQIQQIIHDKIIDNNEIKLMKIAQILNLKKTNQISTPIKKMDQSPQFNKEQILCYERKQYRKQSEIQNIPNNILKQDKEQTKYTKQGKLQQKYQQYIKNNGILKKQNSSLSKSFSKSKRQSVKVSEKKQIFQYGIGNVEEINNDNSILIHQNSDRKSVMSQTNLLQNDE